MKPSVLAVIAGAALVAAAFWLSTIFMSPAPFVILPVVGFVLGRRAGFAGVVQSALAFYIGLAALFLVQSRPTVSDVWHVGSVIQLAAISVPFAAATVVPAILGRFLARRDNSLMKG